jgi:hypothetical protein
MGTCIVGCITNFLMNLYKFLMSVSTSAFLGLSWPASGEKNIANKIKLMSQIKETLTTTTLHFPNQRFFLKRNFSKSLMVSLISHRLSCFLPVKYHLRLFFEITSKKLRPVRHLLMKHFYLKRF